MRAILGRVLEAPELQDPRWYSMSLVFSVSNEGHDVGNSGYAYGNGDDWWAFSVSVPRSRPPVLDYLQDVCGRMPLHPCRVLVQHERFTGRTRLAAETANPDRWRITVDNARSMVDRLKPQFEATGDKSA